ncbi:MBL fold metallo-hydrolase [bacterium]|nr:MBL fold metallo-hydrolase [bacterium]
MRWIALLLAAVPAAALCTAALSPFETDVFPSSQGEIRITFIGHGTLLFEFAGKVIHVDPVSAYADYQTLAKADVILITHEHGDHLDPSAVQLIRKQNTQIVYSGRCAGKLPDGIVMMNGEEKTVAGIPIAAVASYNLVHKRKDGTPFHPRGVGNGYVLTLGDRRIYIAGDTEYIPEMNSLKNIDIAFLPMNLPYTMTPAMTAEAARTSKPGILYPYHTGDTDMKALKNLLKENKEIELRIRKLN